jgi:replicative DNA helicase Mcm
MEESKEIDTVAEEILVEYCQDQLREFDEGSDSIVLNYSDVLNYNVEIANLVTDNPDETLEEFKDAVEALEPQVDNVRVRVKDLLTTTHISDLRARHVNTLVSFEGVVRNATRSREKCLEGVFECQRCGTLTTVTQNIGEFQEPHQCSGCERQGPFLLLEDQSDFVDWQKLRISEPLSKGKGEPEKIDVRLEGDDIVKSVKPGDRVEIVGIPRSRTDGDVVFEKHIEGVHVEKLNKDAKDIDIDDGELEKIREIARNKPLETLSQNLATSIHGYGTIKRAAVLQLVGGVRKEMLDDGEERGTIHIGVIGDPGTGKTKILSRAADAAPRSVSTDGSGSSAAGLTAAAVESNFDERWSIKAGSLVLADQGVACIDELDKMDRKDREKINKALSDGVVQVSKAGKTTQLPARCSLFAAANPQHGRFDEYEPIVDQIDLSDELLSRFDLLYVTTDKPDEERDREILKHLRKHTKAGEKKAANKPTEFSDGTSEEIDTDFLQQYVAHAKTIDPVATDEAFEYIEDFIAEMRDDYEMGDAFPLTLRKYPATVRLAEAHARLRLSETVEREDAEVAVGLMRKSLKQVAQDPETGEIDIDILHGSSKAQRDLIKQIKEIIKELCDESNNGKARKEDIIEVVDGKDGRIESVIDSLRKRGELIEPDNDHFRLVGEK